MNQQRNKVRIIGGLYRRRVLSFPDASGLRPTTDRVRETVFNWLGQELDGKRCLDLFAGSGALGFEAASRGAQRVVMVEKSRAVADVLKANAVQLGVDRAEVFNGDALQFIKRARDQFDVVFLDPPFDSDYLQQVLPLLVPLLSADAVVYIEGRSWPDLAGWVELKYAEAGQVRYGLVARDESVVV